MAAGVTRYVAKMAEGVTRFTAKVRRVLLDLHQNVAAGVTRYAAKVAVGETRYAAKVIRCPYMRLKSLRVHTGNMNCTWEEKIFFRSIHFTS